MALYLGNQKIGGLSAIMQEGVSINVAYGIALPNAIVNNQIFVITNTPPTNIYVDTDAPINPTIGDMWIVVAAGGKAGITFKEGSSSLRIRFTQAIQWNGSDWSAKNGYLGIAGSWVQFAVSKLPEGYTEVEYIQSSGTQYIDTGFVPNNNTRVVMDITVLNGTVSSFFGARKGSTDSSFTAFCLGTTSLRSDYGSSQKSLSISGVGSRVVVDANKNVFNYGSYSVTHSAATFNSTYPLYLLQNNYQGSADDNSCMAAILYSSQVYDNGTLVRDYVPCYRKSDGAIGLYDIVNDGFYGNAGTGTFIAGEKI